MIRRLPYTHTACFVLALSLALPAMTPAPAAAATVVPLTLEEMEARASDIFVGTVESTRAGWDKDHRLIQTRVRIRIDRHLKGKGGKTATIVVPGGVVGEIGMRQSGAAVFRPGERVLLLAEPRGASALRPVGLFQGKMAVTRDTERGIDVVTPPGPAWGTEGQPLPPGAIVQGAAPPLPLDEVVRRLGKAR